MSGPAPTGDGALMPIALYGELFRALSDPIRTEIVRRAALVDELACTALETALPVSKSTISYHVKILSNADLLTVRKQGRRYFYRLREDRIAAILPGFLERLRSSALDDLAPELRLRARHTA
jgi:ArsR family transcriptional regulator, arsenate/arsenite/antimonite-responsive transcriptional repressor